MHMDYMLTNSICLYHSPGSRVLLQGLQKQRQYNGIEGVLVEMDARRESSECPRPADVSSPQISKKP